MWQPGDIDTINDSVYQTTVLVTVIRYSTHITFATFVHHSLVISIILIISKLQNNIYINITVYNNYNSNYHVKKILKISGIKREKS